MSSDFYEVIRSFWVVWLMAIFVGIVVWACWPTRKQSQKMKDCASIPLRDEADAGGH